MAGLLIVFFNKKHYFTSLNLPVDGGSFFMGKPLFGTNKTWLGLITYLLFVPAFCWILYLLEPILTYVVHPVFKQNPLLIGSALAISYILGEHLNSFTKRRVGIGPGKTTGAIQHFFDLSDGIIIALATLLVFFNVSLAQVLISLAAGILTHIFVDMLMVHLSLKR
jgi:hypothetical protein